MKNLHKNTLLIAASTLFLGILLGWLIFGGEKAVQKAEQSTEAENATIWTCSMHPQIRRNEPGSCPICGMDLIPLEAAGQEADPMAIHMSPTAMQLADVQSMVVGSGGAAKSIRLNGKVQADERLRFTQSSHIPGRIEKLMLNFTGEYVKAGQTIAVVYSPELVTAQEELLEAEKIRDSQPGLFNSAKEKLRNWKLSDQQIDQILSSGKAISSFPIHANVSGYVTEKLVNPGDYIKLGQPIYEVADLSRVWVLFEVHETDMTWVRKGSKVSYTIPSLPGLDFTGKISFIDPVIDPKTRVAMARLEMPNAGAKLKPEMFVSGTIETKMDEQAMSVPKSAVMWTGKRSVVYVKQADASGLSFIMREITLGPELGEGFIVESGLNDGEEIAVNGTFSIDAAAQLAGKPSMMNPQGGVAMTGHNHGETAGSQNETPDGPVISAEAKKALQPLYQAYFEMETSLAKDELKGAKSAAKKLASGLSSIDMGIFKGKSHEIWMKESSVLQSAVQLIGGMESLDLVRMNFMTLSNSMIHLAEAFDPLSESVYVQHCPMANSNKGADWLSQNPEILNPYFGPAMLKCGETKREIK
jgi:Cu(I)/Ag(I) efflux system membrane fusion protein